MMSPEPLRRANVDRPGGLEADATRRQALLGSQLAVLFEVSTLLSRFLIAKIAKMQGRDLGISAPAAPKVDLGDPTLDEGERVIAALEEAGWVQAKAARLLNMTPRQIANRIQTLNIRVRQS